MNKEKTYTKGNVIVEEIEVGDIHYEFEYRCCVKSEVISKPVYNEKEDLWEWKSKQLSNGRIIEYAMTPGLSHYGPNLYDYEAYMGCKML